MSTLISVQSLSYDLASGPLLDTISFTIKKGDRIGLIGHNGSGKSTLIRLLYGDLTAKSGSISKSNQCLIARIEQYLPADIYALTLIQAVLAVLPVAEHDENAWKVEVLLSDMGFKSEDWYLKAESLSGGQHTRLLMARALIIEPDLLLLDEPSNHLDLQTLLWLEAFLLRWQGTFILVSHDQHLLDRVSNSTIILRDRCLSFFSLPCTQARVMQLQQDEADQHRHEQQQKEIQRIERSAKRLAIWGQVYDNESFSRKAQSMTKRVNKLKDELLDLSDGSPWTLQLNGIELSAKRLLHLVDIQVSVAQHLAVLFQFQQKYIKSGDHIALIGQNGCGKSTLLIYLWQSWISATQTDAMVFHPQCRLGYYDQNHQQLDGQKTLLEALTDFSSLPTEGCKLALIHAGFAYHRHGQLVESLSGGERARLLFVALSLAQFHFLLLDEPSNHLDLEGKEELILALRQFAGAFILVSHDRELIEKSCNRFWLIQDHQLIEYTDIEQLYTELIPTDQASKVELVQSNQAIAQIPTSASTADELLDRLLELEEKLATDQARKQKHQKLHLQQMWQEEIAVLLEQLDIS